MELYVSEKNIISSVRELVEEFLIPGKEITGAKYHHNTSYKSILSIVEHGILSLNEKNKIGLTNYSKDFLEVMDDQQSHVNGAYGVSLCVVGLTDLYRDEEEYNPLSSSVVDILVSSDIKTMRLTYHYGNEFICYSPIYPTLFKSIDVRLLSYLNYCESKNQINYDDIIKRYNTIVNVGELMLEKKLTMPLREMSDTAVYQFDFKRMSNMPLLRIK